MFEKWFEKYKININRQNARDCINEFKTLIENKKIILYGYGNLGKSLCEILKLIEVCPDIIVDKNQEADYLFKPSLLRTINNYNQYCIILSIMSYYINDVRNDIVKMGLSHLELNNGEQIYILLKTCLCEIEGEKENFSPDILKCVGCIKNTTCSVFVKQFIESNAIRIILPIEKEKERERIIFTPFQIKVGTICNLKCKNCSEGITYAKNKEYVSLEDISIDVMKIAAACYFIPLIQLTGGEPFLHPKLVNIIDMLLSINNVGIIGVVTNGTIIPDSDMIKIFRNKKIIVTISNYSCMGESYVSKLNIIKQIFDDNDVKYLDKEATIWRKSYKYGKSSETEDELKNRYKSCPDGQYCGRQIYKGYLYACTQHFRGEVSQMFSEESSKINIHNYDIETLRNKLINYLNAPYYEICRYCNEPFNTEVVPVAEQL